MVKKSVKIVMCIFLMLMVPVAVVSAADPDLKWDVLKPNATERLIEYEEYRGMGIYDSPLDPETAGFPTEVVNEFPKPSYTLWDQGGCGNCWVWASTAIMAQSYNLSSHSAVPLSIQFFNSNYHDGNIGFKWGDEWACVGGGRMTYADAYNEGLNQSYPGGPFVVPWDNTNASYMDGGMPAGANTTLIAKNLINNTPNFGFSIITVESIIGETEPNQTKAINNLTAVLAEKKVIGFAMGWVDNNNLTYNETRFQNDFNTLPWDTDPYDPSVQNGMTGVNKTGHEMVIIGYNKTDTDPSKWYWIVQNSWGITDGRPKGQFKLKMDMNYNATYYDADNKQYLPIMAFWTFNVIWKTDPTVTSITPSTGENDRWVNITDLDGTGFVDGAVVNLTKTGQPDITSTGYVKVISSNKITTWFNLTEAADGIWDLVVTNPDDRSGTLAKSFTITKAPPTPVTNFTVNQTRINTAPAAVQFSDTSLNNPTSWSWNFGDGNTSTLQNPVNTYRHGIFNVSLTATNAYGSNTLTRTNYITVNSLTPINSTIGIFRNGEFFLASNNSDGGGTVNALDYGQTGDMPVIGDWNGDGLDTVGIFRNGEFFLASNNSDGGGTVNALGYGQTGDMPVIGDWNGDGTDTVGIFRNGSFFLASRNENGGGTVTAFNFGQAGDVPVIGDWDGDGLDTAGIFRSGTFFLASRNENGGGTVTAFNFGMTGDVPVTGGWNEDGVTEVGIFRNGVVYLASNNIPGGGTVTAFTYGMTGDEPVAGKWT